MMPICTAASVPAARGVANPTRMLEANTNIEQQKMRLARSAIPPREYTTSASEVANVARRSKSPNPGQAFGNVEKSRCTGGSMRATSIGAKTLKRVRAISPRVASNRDESPLQSQRHRLGAIVRVQLGEDALEMAFGRFFADGQARGDLFVRLPMGYELQDFDFPARQGKMPYVFRNLSCDIRLNVPLAETHDADGVQNLRTDQTFQHISLSAGLQRTFRQRIA